MPTIKITTRKDGRVIAWFREERGRVRTRAGTVNWATADQVRALAEYGIALQKAQCAAGLGSDGLPMPALKGGGGLAVFTGRSGGRARFVYRGYAQQKAMAGLQPKRDLRGPGKDGHMLDDIRINYLDDRMATFAITRQSSRNKARGNEMRAPWWGWSPESVRLLAERGNAMFPLSVGEKLAAMGLIGAEALADARRFLRKVA